jgi:hypothetical protein
VYHGIPPSIPVSTIAASCQPDAGLTTCDVGFVRLNPGRFYIRTQGPAASVTITVGDPAAVAQAHVLLVRTEPGRLIVDADTDPANTDAFGGEVRQAGERIIIPVPRPAPAWNRITFVPAWSGAPVVVSELGFFAGEQGLLRSNRQPFPWIPGSNVLSPVVAAMTLAVCALVVIAAWLAPGVMKRPSPWLVALLCASVCLLELGTLFSPYSTLDLRSSYGADLISPSSANLTGGPWEGSRLVQGLGQTIVPGIVQWHRMPGYGLFCALAAILGGTTDVVEIAMVVILLQVILYSVSVGTFVGVARRVFDLHVACLLGVLITLLPKQLNYTEVDSIIAPISLIVLSALVIYLANTHAGKQSPFRVFLLVNAAFALWFLMRNDVLPGWIVVSAALAGRRWWRLLLPVVLMLTIALPWALYKRQYRHEFNLLPTNAGEVLFLSLCEVPGAFPYECTDDGYFEWARRVGHPDPSSQRTSNLATAEVVRNWVTYPVHFAFMVWFKARRCVFGESWPGFRTPLNLLYGGIVRSVGLFFFLVAVVAVSFAVNHQRCRSLLLGWALFLNMPIFFVVFASSGRFYAAAGVSLIVVAIPLLFERGLYAQVRHYPWRAAVVIACVGLFIAGGRRVEDWVVANDSVHYWAPLLDPSRSTLEFLAR